MMSSLLVVEDETNIRRFVVANLLARGFSAAEAENAEEGLEKLRDEPLPSALILDIRLPGMSGLEMLDILSSDDRLSTIPVIVMSASTVGAQVGKDQYDNVVRWLVKPVSVQELILAVNQALNQ